MSGGGNNWSPTMGSWPIRRGYSDRVRTAHPAFNRSLTRRTTDASEAAQGPGWLFDERVMAGPLGITSFPVQPHHPLEILLLDSPPRFTDQWNMQLPAQEEDDSRLTKEEQKKALGKLKKETYKPTLKNLSKRLCLYYRDNARNNYNARANEIDDDGKRCAICLDDFEAREEVTITPCNHMFHENCIVPWVKSHGQCPVCRFTV